MISEGFWSEWRGSNARSPGPKPGAIPTSLHPDIYFSVSQYFVVCGHCCGQRRFRGAFRSAEGTRKRPCVNGFHRFGFGLPGYRHGTPKPGALPTALHSVIAGPAGGGPPVYISCNKSPLQLQGVPAALKRQSPSPGSRSWRPTGPGRRRTRRCTSPAGSSTGSPPGRRPWRRRGPRRRRR